MNEQFIRPVPRNIDFSFWPELISLYCGSLEVGLCIMEALVSPATNFVHSCDCFASAAPPPKRK